jgi:hypothetical protein
VPAGLGLDLIPNFCVITLEGVKAVAVYPGFKWTCCLGIGKAGFGINIRVNGHPAYVQAAKPHDEIGSSLITIECHAYSLIPEIQLVNKKTIPQFSIL